MSDNADVPPKQRSGGQPAPPKPRPRPQDPIEQEFWRRCQDGMLHFQRCSSCRAWRHLPRYMCARCGSPEFTFEPSSGRGTLFSWTVTHQALHPAFAAEIPFVAAVVELEEGVRMATRLVDCEIAAVRIDMPLELAFEQIGDDFRLPVFRPTTTKG